MALGERVRLLQEERTAMVSERTNATLFILTVVTVLALPLTIIPSLFGMNVAAFRSLNVRRGSGSSSCWCSASSAGAAVAWRLRDRS